MVLRTRGLQSATRLAALFILIAPVLAACSGGGAPHVSRSAFTSKEFGVGVSPRVTKAKYPPRGGGRYLPLKPYVVRGVTYQPVEGPGYVETGIASWYGNDFHGRRTANGEIFGASYITGASPTLPIPCYARVTNLENGRSVLVRFNDRGPYMSGRVADLSYKTAEILGYANKGSARVRVEYVSPAPLNGDDSKMLIASVGQSTIMEQGTIRTAMLEAPVPAGPPSRDPFSGGLVGDIVDLFGYSEVTDANVNGALAAATAMATRDRALADWVSVTDADALSIRLQLGEFEDPAESERVAEAFAMLGAVDPEDVTIGGRPALRLTLTHLKPGVARADVMALVRELGLKDIVLY